MAGPIRIAILANGRQARREINQVNTALGGLGKLAKGGLAVAGLTSLTYAVGGFVKSSVEAEAKFSTSMRLIQAATKAPSAAMGRLNDLAIKLGQDTAFSASESADAMLELAKSGIKTKTILHGGLAGTLQLAAAGGTELGTAATIASNALNTFSLKGRDMASVAAALAGGANASSASVESLGQALQQVGPGATNAGLSLQETVAALSAFDAAGIKGSDAGTSLKTMLTRLVPMTNKAREAANRLGLDFVKANGEFLSMTGIAAELKRELAGLTRAERTKALATIFGSDATRAATVLAKEGASGLREFIKATNDQNAAQKMAEARMSGTAGALERLSGTVETAKLRLGQELAPIVEKTADALGKKLVPALEEGVDIAKTFGRAVEPAAKILWELAKFAGDATSFLLDLPDPIKETAIQAGLAALVLPRFAASVTGVTAAVTTNIARLKQFQAELTYTATRSQAATAMMTRLGTAARTTAGIGGMVALTQGAQTSNKALSTLANVGGGALLGFSVGGPIGAAIGAGAGGLLSLYQNTRKTSDAMSTAEANAREYADSINAIAAASGRAQRAEALTLIQREGMIPVANSLGISTQELVAATLGNERAQRRVRNAYEGTTDILRSMQGQDLGRWLSEQGFALSKARTQIERTDAALKKYDGTAKKTSESAAGVNKSLRSAGNVSPQMGKYLSALTGGMQDAERRVHSGSDRLNKGLRDGTAKARPNLDPFKGALISGLNGVEGPARSGGQQIGDAMQAGVVAGFAGTANQLAAMAYSAVAGAIGNARKAGDIHSPSRKMRTIGEQLGAGLVEGLTRQQRAAELAAGRLTAGALTGARGTYSPGAKALDAYVSAARRSGGRSAEVLRVVGTLDTPWGPADIEGIVDDRLGDHRTHNSDRAATVYGGAGSD